MVLPLFELIKIPLAVTTVFFSVKAYKNLSSGRYCKKLPFMSNANALTDISPDDTKSCVHFSLSHIFVDVCLNGTYFPVAYFVITLCYCYCLFNVEYAIATFYKFYPDKCQTILLIQRRHLGY